MERWRGLVAAAVTALGAAGVLGACGGGAGSGGGETAGAKEMGPPSAVYTVRGRVVTLPDPAKPLSEFRVKHEAIDNFVDASGEVVGMGVMEMPFPLAEGVSLEGVEAGDVVEVTFAVWWEPRRHYEATKVVELPGDTELDFGEGGRGG